MPKHQRVNSYKPQGDRRMTSVWS